MPRNVFKINIIIGGSMSEKCQMSQMYFLVLPNSELEYLTLRHERRMFQQSGFNGGWQQNSLFTTDDIMREVAKQIRCVHFVITDVSIG